MEYRGFDLHLQEFVTEKPEITFGESQYVLKARKPVFTVIPHRPTDTERQQNLIGYALGIVHGRNPEQALVDARTLVDRHLGLGV